MKFVFGDWYVMCEKCRGHSVFAGHGLRKPGWKCLECNHEFLADDDEIKVRDHEPGVITIWEVEEL